MNAEQRQSALLATPAGRAALGFDAEFASNFNPEGWQASTLQRASAGRPRGAPCYRKGKQVIHELPSGYEAGPDGRVRRSSGPPDTVTVPGNKNDSQAAAAWDSNTNFDSVMRQVGNPGVTNARKLFLFAVACTRELADKLSPRGREVLDGLEQLADHRSALVFNDKLTTRARNLSQDITNPDSVVRDLAYRVPRWSRDDWDHDVFSPAAAGHAAIKVARHVLGTNLLDEAGSFRPEARPPLAALQARQVGILKSIVGNPYRTASVPTDRNIRDLANGAKDHASMSILADALEERGASPQVTDSLRDPNAPVRGHWVLDALLGRK